MVSAILLAFMTISVPALQSMNYCDLKGGNELPASRQQRFTELIKSAPDKAAVFYDMALNYAAQGNTEKALHSLMLALQDTPWLDPSGEVAFKAIAGCAEFQRIAGNVKNKYPPVLAARIVKTVQQPDLIPEGITTDGKGTLYISSIFHKKIVKVAPDGRVTDFVKEGQDGLLGVLGLKYDRQDGTLWAASERSGQAALFHFGASGNTISKFVPSSGGKHLFNDIALASNGDVFVTDSEDGSVYTLPHGSSKLVRLDLHGRIYPNGIELSSDEGTLFVAHAYGIVAMNRNSGSVTDLAAPKDVSVAQIDGMSLWNGSLIAIQNGFGSNRIVQLRLAPDGKSIVSGKLLEFRSQNLELPTTGTVHQGTFYYMVNTQIDHEDDGRLKRQKELKPIKVAALALP